jgi:transposase-like protein
MRSGDLAPFGSGGGAVEADETFIWNDPTRPKPKGARGFDHKMKVLTLIDRTTRRSRNFVVDNVKAATLAPLIRENIAKEARLMTDEARHYLRVGKEFAEHGVVEHGAGEYVRGDAHTNNLEGYYSIFKRGMKGIYQHCGKQHPHRYVAEFEFRYNNRSGNGVNDGDRAKIALKGATGKRLTYAN